MKNQYTNKLNKFLSSDKAEQQSALFKRWIKEDKTFADEVTLYKKLEVEFSDTEKQQLREELQRLGKKYFESQGPTEHPPVSTREIDEVEEILKQKISWKNKMRKFKYCLMQIAAISVAFVIGITIISPSLKKGTRIPEIPNNKIAPIPYVRTPDALPENIKDMSLEPALKNIPENNMIPGADQGLAYTDVDHADNYEQYASNETMAVLSYNNKRSAAFQIKMKTPIAGDYPIVAGKVHLELAAEIISSETLIQENIIFKIFSNKQEDYIKDRHLLKTPVHLRQKGNKAYTLSFNGKVPLQHGLFYYMIENTEDDRLLYAGAFTVGKAGVQTNK